MCNIMPVCMQYGSAFITNAFKKVSFVYNLYSSCYVTLSYAHTHSAQSVIIFYNSIKKRFLTT